MKKSFHAAAILLCCLSASLAVAEPGKVLYENNFEKADLDQVPDGLMVLDGDFAVKQSDGNKYLELPGAPLDSYGLLFGSSTNFGVSVQARIFGTARGRRAPTFGVGLNGVSGYKLKISPGKNALEIFKGDDSVANVPFKWKTGVWTVFRLRVRQAGPTAWKVEGKAWPQSESEPSDWMVTFDETTAPHDGRPSIWGSPISGTPIRFDDLKVTSE